MDGRFFCIIRDARGIPKVSAKSADLSATPDRDWLPTFDRAYSAARKQADYERPLRRKEHRA